MLGVCSSVHTHMSVRLNTVGLQDCCTGQSSTRTALLHPQPSLLSKTGSGESLEKPWLRAKDRLREKSRTETLLACRFHEAMEANDTGKRLAAISTLLGAEEVTVQDKAELLEELTEIVENIDHARDLHSVGGLPALIGLLSSPESTLRWHAAGVVAAACQSNPPVSPALLLGHSHHAFTQSRSE